MSRTASRRMSCNACCGFKRRVNDVAEHDKQLSRSYFCSARSTIRSRHILQELGREGAECARVQRDEGLAGFPHSWQLAAPNSDAPQAICKFRNLRPD